MQPFRRILTYHTDQSRPTDISKETMAIASFSDDGKEEPAKLDHLRVKAKPSNRWAWTSP